MVTAVVGLLKQASWKRENDVQSAGYTWSYSVVDQTKTLGSRRVRLFKV